MSEHTTIQVSVGVLRALKRIKEHPRQSYDEVITRILEKAGKKKTSQYDEFLHKVQQQKMRELWGSEEDEEWEHA